MRRLLIALIILTALIIIGFGPMIFTGLTDMKHESDLVSQNRFNGKENSKFQPSVKGGTGQEETSGFEPDINVSSAVLVEQKSGKILYEKVSKERCFPASTTKILTALIAMENGDLNEVITVGEEANMAPLDSSKAGIYFGEKLKLETLLKCLLIPSGNDAAYVIAVHIARKVGGDSNMEAREAVGYFCKMMNKRARKAGALDSNFVNPDGYQQPEHYTTAFDIALIAKEAMKYSTFRNIVRSQTYRLPDIRVCGNNGKMQTQVRLLINTNKLIMKDSGYFFKYATGIKTGHTQEAGYCLVSSASYNDRSIIAVIMNSTENDIWSESRKLMEWGLSGNE